MAASQSEDKRPQRDPAEDNAFFPSPYSLGQFTKPKSDLGGADYPNPYNGKKKVLMIGADERYLLTDNGTFFSTGNHPVETLLPMYHLDKAGFRLRRGHRVGKSRQVRALGHALRGRGGERAVRVAMPRLCRSTRLRDANWHKAG